MICQERISVCLSIYISLHEDRAVVVGRAKESNVLDPPPWYEQEHGMYSPKNEACIKEQLSC